MKFKTHIFCLLLGLSLAVLTGGCFTVIDFEANKNLGPPELIVDLDALTINEGQTAELKVRLGKEPENPIIVTVSTPQTDALTITKTLRFTATDYGVNQMIRVSSNHDVDTEDLTTSITLSREDSGPITIPIQILDDDALAILLESDSIYTIDENGGETNLKVRLSHQPSEDVEIAIMPSSDAVTVSSSKLTLGSTNWEIPQMITVTGKPDDNDYDDEIDIMLTAMDVMSAAVTVTVTDNDVQAAILSPGTLSLVEGETAKFTVRLAYQPKDSIDVSLASTDNQALSLATDSLAFAPANWNTEQEIEVSAPQDDDLLDEAVSIHATPDSFEPSIITAIVSDDDTQSVIFNPTTIMIGEGQTESLSFRLAYEPATDVEVQLTSSNPGTLNVSPGPYTFTEMNWSTNKVVNVTSSEDPNLADEMLTITATDGEELGQALITVIDNDTQAMEISSSLNGSSPNLHMSEGGVGSLEINLLFMPASTATVGIRLSSPDVISVSPSVLNFDAIDYNQAKSFSIIGLDDSNLTDDPVILTLSTYNANEIPITITVTDNDTQSISVNPPSINLTEGGPSADIEVALAFEPTATSSITAVSSDIGAVTVSSSTLAFDISNYATTQTFTVTPVDDLDVNAETVIITIFERSGSLRTDVVVNVTDDD